MVSIACSGDAGLSIPCTCYGMHCRTLRSTTSDISHPWSGTLSILLLIMCGTCGTLGAPVLVPDWDWILEYGFPWQSRPPCMDAVCVVPTESRPQTPMLGTQVKGKVKATLATK